MIKTIHSFILLVYLGFSFGIFAQTDKQIVKNISIDMQVQDIKTSLRQLETLIEKSNGYSLSNSYTNANQHKTGSIVARLPNKNLDTALIQIKKIGVKLISTNLTTNDLTQSYLQANSDLLVKQKQMRQINALIKKSTNSKEVASVFNTMLALQTSINQLEGEIKYINSVTAYPKLTINVLPTAIAKSKDPYRWQLMNTLNRGVQSLLDSLNSQYKGLIYFFIYYVPLILIWLCMTAILYFVFLSAYHYFKQYKAS